MTRRLPSKLIPTFRSFYRILLAVDNAFSAPLFAPKLTDTSDLALFTQRGADASNVVQDLLNSKKVSFLSLKSNEEVLDAAPSDLTPTSLREWNGGPYAIRLAPFYVEHVKGNLKFLKARVGDQTIYKVRGFRSRFSKTQARTVWVIFASVMRATRCYCGTRTIGGCSHAVALLWYILQERGQVKMNKRLSVHEGHIEDLSAWSVNATPRGR